MTSWLTSIKEPEMNGVCPLDNRPAVPVGNQIAVDGNPLELCQDCYGKPVAVVLLQLANLSRRANMAPPVPRQ